ncbi:MAG: domain, G-beta repeat [Planctomycetota bacterium]|nr:domain, G-beta repeat [Planctomycetota bacterium]
MAIGAEIDFYRDVYPILKSNCIACHNKTTTKAALNMETPEAMRKGGDSGEGVIPGNGAESLIFQAAAHIGNVEMPPRGNKSGASKLKPDELALLRAWIDQGAKSSVKQTRQVVWQPLPPGVHPIYSVAMTRDGRVAACGRANQVFVYDLATRQFDESLTNAHKALVQSLAFSPDGMRLASGSFREVKIWRRENGPVTSRKGDPALGVVVSVLSADRKQVVCADKQGTLHVLDAANGESLKTIPTDDQGGTPLLSLSPDATKAALYGTRGTLSLWNLLDGRRIASKDGLLGVRTLTWTRDGKTIATGGEDKVVRLWPLPIGDGPGLVASKEFKGATAAIMALEAGTDLLIAAGADGKVQVWNIPEAKPIREIAIAGVVALGLSEDSKRFAAGRSDGVVQVFDLVAGNPIIELSGDPETNARLAALDSVIAAEGLEMAFQKQEAIRIEAQSKGLDELLKKASESIEAVKKELVEKQNALKPATDAKEAAQKAATAVTDQVAKAPEGKPDAALVKLQKDAEEKLMAATLAESTALTAFKASEIHLKDAEAEAQNYSSARARNKTAVAAANAADARAKAAQDKATADATATKKAAADHKLLPLAVRFSTDQQAVGVAWSDGSLRVWAIASGLPTQHLPGGGGTTNASLVSCGDNVFAASVADGSTAVLSTASRWILERTLGGESADSPLVDRVNALRFSPDGKTLAAGGGEPTRSGDISLWDVASGKLVNEWKERHSDAVLSLDFSPDGKHLASGGADKIARVTDIASGKLLNVFEGHTHHVLGVSFRADGRVLATAGADNSVVVWDMISGERKKKIEGWSKEVTSLQYIGATNQILTSAGDNLVRIVDDNGGVVRDMAKLPDFMQSAASAATASLMIGGGEDSVLRVWNGTTGQELATFGPDASAKKP